MTVDLPLVLIYFSPQLSTAIKLKKAAIIFVMKLPSTRSPKLRLLCRLPGWIPWGNFRGNRSCWRSIFTFSHILFTSHTLQLTRGNLCSWKKNKSRRKSWEKKRKQKKRKQAQRRKKEYQKFLCESDWFSRAPRWRPDFEQRSRRQTKICQTWC